MPQIPLGVGAYNRPYGKLPEIRMVNRFFESNPVGAEQTALLSRPGTKLLLEVGTGPIRTLHSQPGAHGGDLFIVSKNTLYRYNGTDTPTEITGTVAGTKYPVMASLSIPNWEAVFISDGVKLQYYEGESYAFSKLTSTGAIALDETVEIDGVYYVWKNAADVDAGSPAGTSANPWRIALGSSAAKALNNLHDAINGLGTPGTTRSTDLEAHAKVRARSLTTTSFEIAALTAGTAGNALTTTETGLNLAWTAGTMAGGGVHELKEIVVPDGQSVVDITTLASHVILAIGNSHKFYWIKPGEVTIDALDYSSAESEPDQIVNILAVGDQLWIFGQSSTEAWYASGDANQPFLRSQGRAFSQGVLSGTLAHVQDSIVVVGQDRVAYRIAGQPERISHHGIEELIRKWQESL